MTAKPLNRQAVVTSEDHPNHTELACPAENTSITQSYHLVAPTLGTSAP